MPRIQSLDLARGFTVLFIPAIHSVMLYSDPEVHTSWLGYILTFIAEGPGGQLFMLIMGIVFTFKNTHEHMAIMFRTLMLLIAGYLLNILKFIIPYAMGVLSEGVYRDLQLTEGNDWWQLLLLGDILHFAAIALVIIHLVYRLKNYWFWSAAIALIIILISPLIWDITVQNPVFNYVSQLVGGQPPQIFFPMLPWIIYPLIGLTIGYCVNKFHAKTFRQLGWYGLIIMAAGWAITFLSRQISSVGFYRTYPGETLMHLGLIMLTLTFWNWMTTKCRTNHFLTLITWCSENITAIYIIQWILICWLLPFIGYQTLSLTTSLLVCLLTSLITFSLVHLFNQINTKK